MMSRTLHGLVFCCLMAGGSMPVQSLIGYAPLSAFAQKEAIPTTDPEKAFHTGAELTHEGRLEEALPYLIAARSRPSLKNSASFDLALCYLGLRRYSQALDLLEELRVSGYNNVQVNILRAQGYVGIREPEKALTALRQAITLSPASEKPYAFVADACTDNKQYELGLRVTELGLEQFPSSARLHYERAMFLAQLDRFEEAKPEFERAAALDPTGDIAYLALAQKLLFQGDIETATEAVRSGIHQGHHDYVLETLLAGILMHRGAIPGQKDFSEARELLEDSVRRKPDYSTAQIALGQLCLMEGRFKDSIVHLEIGRRLEPQNRAVYTSLAHAYRRTGDEKKAREMLNQLQELIQEGSRSDGSM